MCEDVRSRRHAHCSRAGMRALWLLGLLACDAGMSSPGSPDGGTTTPLPDGSTMSFGSPLEFDPGPNEGVSLAKIGDTGMRIITPTLVEIWRINTKAPDPARVDSWDFVDENSGTLNAPSGFQTSVGAVKSVGFRRRPRYAPFAARDLRIGNSIYLV